MRVSEVFRGFRGFQRFFKGPLRDPLRAPFSSQSCGVVLPLIVLPLKTCCSLKLQFQCLTPNSFTPIFGLRGRPKAILHCDVGVVSMPNMTGRPGHGTMEMNGGSSAPYLACAPCVPLFVHCLIRVEAEGLLDYQGRAGISSIVRWNLRPVIFGVDCGPWGEECLVT